MRGSRGMTLIELIVTIVVVSMAATTILGVMSATANSSAQAMLHNQAVSIAGAYLQNTTAQPFTAISGYNGPATDALGNSVGQYQVSVVIQAVANFGPAGATVPAKQITVTVTDQTGAFVTLTGYRTSYR